MLIKDPFVKNVIIPALCHLKQAQMVKLLIFAKLKAQISDPGRKSAGFSVDQAFNKLLHTNR